MKLKDAVFCGIYQEGVVTDPRGQGIRREGSFPHRSPGHSGHCGSGCNDNDYTRRADYIYKGGE